MENGGCVIELLTRHGELCPLRCRADVYIEEAMLLLTVDDVLAYGY